MTMQMCPPEEEENNGSTPKRPKRVSVPAKRTPVPPAQKDRPKK